MFPQPHFNTGSALTGRLGVFQLPKLTREKNARSLSRPGAYPTRRSDLRGPKRRSQNEKLQLDCPTTPEDMLGKPPDVKGPVRNMSKHLYRLEHRGVYTF